MRRGDLPLAGSYAAGQRDTTAAGGQAVLTRHRGDGSTLWTDTWMPTDPYSYAIFQKVACDAAGDAYVAALAFDGTRGLPSVAIAKYAPNGSRLWMTTLNPPPGIVAGNVDDLRVTSAGDAYLLAAGYNATTYAQASMTVKFDASGNQLWTAQTSSALSALALDSYGNAYVTGRACVTAAYAASDGSLLWQRQYAAPSGGQTFENNVIVQGSTVTVVGGSYSYDGQCQTAFLLRYDTTGNQQWVSTWTPPAGQSTYWQGAVVDASGDSYVAAVYPDVGQTNFGVSDNVAVLEFGPAGQLLDATPLSLGSKAGLSVGPVRLDAAGDLLLFGQAGSDVAVARVDLSSGVSEVGLAAGKKNTVYMPMAAASRSGHSILVAGASSSSVQSALLAKFIF